MTSHEHTLRFPGTLSGFEAANTSFHRLLDDWRLQGAPRSKAELAFEEIAVNIVRHGSPTTDVVVAIAFDEREVSLTFEDDGIPFDPLQQPDPRLPDSLEDAPIGGLGVMLVKQLSTRMRYERTPEHRNRLSLAISAL